MSNDQEIPKGLNILCIDGGGVGGLSSLIILQEIMRCAEITNGKEKIHPHEYFDIIAGTGTGGISACMLGKLHIPIDKAIIGYTKLVEEAFAEKKLSGPTMYKGTKLQEALKRMIREATGDEETTMMEDRDSNGCKTIVFAMSKHNLNASLPVMFRSYVSRDHIGENPAIWKVLYATMARPDLFKSIEIVEHGMPQAFIGGTIGCSNPLAHVLSEVQRLYPGRQVACIISIGAGHARTIQALDSNRWYQTQDVDMMKDLVTDSERVAEEMAMRFQGARNVYFRFNLDQGIQYMRDWSVKRLEETKWHTKLYLQKGETKHTLEAAIRASMEAHGTISTTRAAGIAMVEDIKPLTGFKHCPAPTTFYTGRQDENTRVATCIAGGKDERRVCVVYGLGGAGKTQLVRKVIERTTDVWKEIIYIEAGARKLIERSLEAVALAKRIGSTYGDALRWLESSHEPWLIVFDGVDSDELSLALCDYIPSGNRGSIVITTRLVGMTMLAQGPGSTCHLSSMNPEDAMTLLVKLSRFQTQDQEPSDEEVQDAKMILEKLGYLALAVVQAGSFIGYSPAMSITRYRSLLASKPQAALESYNQLPTRIDDYEHTVCTTWMTSYEQLGPQAKEVLWFVAFLYHTGINIGGMFQQAAMSIGSYKPIFSTTPSEELAQERLQKFLSTFLADKQSWNELMFLQVINEITSHSLLEYDSLDQVYRIHVLVQAWVRTIIPYASDYASTCSRALLSASIPCDQTQEAIEWRRKLALHVDEALFSCPTNLEPNYAYAFSAVYQDSEQWEKLKDLQEHIRDTSVHTFGEGHPETLKSMGKLAETYSKLGRHNEASILRVQVDRVLAGSGQSQDQDINDMAKGPDAGLSENQKGRPYNFEPASETLQPHPGPTLGRGEINDSGSAAGPSALDGSGSSQGNSGKGGEEQDTPGRNPGNPLQRPTKPNLVSQPSKTERGLNILCIDGGGVRGLSSLIVLREMMYRIYRLEEENTPKESLRPADWFDLIAGTGTGGVSACMLGRLGMSITTAIETYSSLMETVFSQRKRTGEHMYKAESLKTFMQSIVKDSTNNQEEKMTTDLPHLNGCNTLVFAMLKHNLNAGTQVMFRSYQTGANPAPDCTIWETLCATMAHPDFFKSIDITEDSLKYTLVSGELGTSNPLAHVLTEVRELYPGRHVSCIMSIGAGHVGTIHIPDSTYHWASLAQGTRIKSMASDSERVAEEMAKRFQGTGVYFRFNVDQGIQDIEADDWEKLSSVNAHAHAYLIKNEVRGNLDDATKAVYEKRAALAVEYIDGRIQCASMPILFKSCPVPTALFTGWTMEIQAIGNCLVNGIDKQNGKNEGQKICILYGLGGAGKSQLALKVIEHNRDRWVHVIYVDAASSLMIEGTLRNFARAKCLGSTYTHTLQFLQATRDPWLLVFDNADDPSFLDNQTRIEDLRHLARPAGSTYSISGMNPEEATSLLLRVVNIRASCDLEIQANKQTAGALVQDFDYLALAIVHAGAYIAHSRGMSILEYRSMFLKKRRSMLEKVRTLRLNISDYKYTVYTTWNMCYELLGTHGKAQQLLWLIAFLHCNGITRAMFQRATTKVRTHKPVLQKNEIEEAASAYLKKYLLNFRSSEEDWVDDQFLDTINELASYSLIEYDERNRAYTINVLVQDWARSVIPEDVVHALERTTSLLSIALDADPENDPKSYQFRSELGLHVNKIISEKAPHGGICANHAASFASVFKCTGQWQEEGDMRLKVRAAREHELGPKHPATLQSMDDLAHNYRNRNQFDMAESLYNEVLQIRILAQGEDHDDTQTSKKYLASLYQARGRHSEAIPLLLDVVGVRRIMKGGNDPETLTCTGNLADAYYGSKQLDKAKELRLQMIDLLSDKDPEKPMCKRRLADILELEGDWDTAEKLLVQSVKDSDRIFGERHHDAIAGRTHLYEFRVRKCSVPPASYDRTSLEGRVVDSFVLTTFSVLSF